MEKINLPDVTLVAISSIYIQETIRALLYSMKDINFGEVKFITHEYPQGMDNKIDYNWCPKINNIMDFNNFAFYDLGDYIQTKHALLIQYHGFILHANKFSQDFLEFDYLGSPWRVVENSYIADNGERVRVGNGGFSLRSSKIMRIPKQHHLELKQEQGFYNEDGNLVCYHRSKMLELGIKYGDVHTAARFGFENYIPENAGIGETFGWHRNLPYWESRR